MHSGFFGYRAFLFSLAIAAGGESACSRAPIAAPPTARRVIEVREGFATYYAGRFNGRTTASGTTFDNRAMVAAHPAYPFGTVVRVTNLANARTVNVAIVDRGPARGPRGSGVIIDLSRAAAQSLDFVRSGRTRVRLEVLSWGHSPAG